MAAHPGKGNNTLGMDEEKLLGRAVERLSLGFAALPQHTQAIDLDRLAGVLTEVSDRMQDNFPYHHPLYAGQMLKPPHPVARLAYALAMHLNPNNHALDGGRASSAMEKEAVSNLAAMVGWREYLGHLTGGGTLANLEALWVAGRLRPGAKIMASEQAHYTHARISEVLGLDFAAIPVDGRARMDLEALRRMLEREVAGTVVATLGTTAVGAIDPLPELMELRQEFGFRLHVDAAYGGYYMIANNLSAEAGRAFSCLAEADSIVIDPHKHGLQPYGCGCILFRDPAVGRFYRHDSPYTYFSSDELHLGEISLECSRAGAAAVALWATQRLLPMERGSEFARNLERCREAALTLYQRLLGDPRYLTIFPPELDIVLWAPRAASASAISDLSRDYFKRAAAHNLHLALADLPSSLLMRYWENVDFDEPTVTCLRSCLMKPEHLDWIGRIWEILDKIAR